VSRRRPPSLRARLTAASVALITATVALADLVLVWRVHDGLLTGLDSTLTQRVQDVAVEAASGTLAALRSTGSDGAVVVQVIDPAGRVVASTANVAGEPGLFPPGTADRSTASDVPGLDPGGYRIAVAHATTPTGPVTVYAAQPVAELTRSTSELSSALLIGTPIVIAALSALVWLLVGRALHPVETMRLRVERLSSQQGHGRVADVPAPVELAHLAATFDELLNGVTESVERERAFLSDAAHELRNPAAAILTRLEIHPEGGLDRVAAARVRHDATRLASLVDGLLSLARLDTRVPLAREVVDLDDVVFGRVPEPTYRGVPVDLTRVAPVQVDGDRAALERVVANLLDNAARHAATGITVSLGASSGSRVVLAIADDGPGIPAADRERVFTRFVRLTSATDEPGAGLGLPIVRDILERHGGTIRIEDSQPGARVVVTLPMAGHSYRDGGDGQQRDEQRNDGLADDQRAVSLPTSRGRPGHSNAVRVHGRFRRPGDR
jgi:signal transduction histidine kinase